jgi:hypothetical protein
MLIDQWLADPTQTLRDPSIFLYWFRVIAAAPSRPPCADASEYTTSNFALSAEAFFTALSLSVSMSFSDNSIDDRRDPLDPFQTC